MSCEVASLRVKLMVMKLLVETLNTVYDANKDSIPFAWLLSLLSRGRP